MGRQADMSCLVCGITLCEPYESYENNSVCTCSCISRTDETEYRSTNYLPTYVLCLCDNVIDEYPVWNHGIRDAACPSVLGWIRNN